ncbi:hypothetical protein [Photorhabdus heterorhabditis]|uniref:hypothetical protein n=1 Tax=Photorhabdus heterorhabditis TaxID=880156 RepID=UPI001BD2AA44|nr:hypothetical protein [Photorhabdus heterorhabditis]MBS9440815.1 hypothetical protein [Photorhabdus heterorhabditis]
MVWKVVRWQRHLVFVITPTSDAAGFFWTQCVVRKISNNLSKLAAIIQTAERNHPGKLIVESKINPQVVVLMILASQKIVCEIAPSSLLLVIPVFKG